MRTVFDGRTVKRMSQDRIALIPAYEPELELVSLVRELRQAGMEVVVVNDGSSADKIEIFQMLEMDALVLTHKENQGKGSALKSGFRFIKEHFSAPYVVVTVDADGQHTPQDVWKVCEETERHRESLVLGSRCFTGDVPAKSKWGNRITRFVYEAFTKRAVYDTQTGLRGCSDVLLPEMLNVKGERYEYEMNVLLECARKQIPIREVAIETIYVEGNASSHFDAWKDSYRIYKEILKFSIASFSCFILDYGLYTIFVCLLQNRSHGVMAANILARGISAIANFLVNKCMVFQSEEELLHTFFRYFALAGGILAGNTIVLEVLVQRIGVNAFGAKLCVECLFFFVSWFVQSHMIFVKRKEEC